MTYTSSTCITIDATTTQCLYETGDATTTHALLTSLGQQQALGLAIIIALVAALFFAKIWK